MKDNKMLEMKEQNEEKLSYESKREKRKNTVKHMIMREKKNEEKKNY